MSQYKVGDSFSTGYNWESIEGPELKGEVVSGVFSGGIGLEDAVLITFESGLVVGMWHKQDCCEYVYLEDVTGNPQDLVGGEVVVCEVRYEDASDDEDSSGWSSGDSDWSFLEIRTTKGDCTFRWYGSSNGYYSTTADVCILKPKETGYYRVEFTSLLIEGG